MSVSEKLQAPHGLRTVQTLADDILICGSGETVEKQDRAHNRCLDAACRCYLNIKLTINKVKFCQENATFFGHVLTSPGAKTNSDKIISIFAIEHTKDVTTLPRYLSSLSTVSGGTAASSDEQGWAMVVKLWKEESAFLQLNAMVTPAPVQRYFYSIKSVCYSENRPPAIVGDLKKATGLSFPISANVVSERYKITVHWLHCYLRWQANKDYCWIS